MPIGTQGKEFTKAWLLKLIQLMDARNGFDAWDEDLPIDMIDNLDDLDMQLHFATRKAQRLLRELT